MKYLFILYFSFIYFPNTLAQVNGTESDIKWELQITDPEFELKYFKLGPSDYKAFMAKTSWRCSTSATQKRGKIELKKLFCDYSVEKTGTVTTTVSCSPSRPYSEATLEIYDERKDLSFQVMLNCRKSAP